MENTKDLLGFFRGKRILLTGHTGFKGAWLSELLLYAGAEVTGYALPAPSGGIFQALCLEERMTSVIGDVRDLAHLRQVFQACRPEIVFHLAAQPLPGPCGHLFHKCNGDGPPAGVCENL